MQIIGQKVEHQIFGAGTVTAKGEGFLTVSFPQGEKSFLYPDAFSRFLVLQDRELQTTMLGTLEQRDREHREQEQAEQAQWRKEANLRTMRISSRSQAVFHIPGEELDGVFARWSVSTGNYMSGNSRGEPRIPDRMKPNSMCILTTRPEEAGEDGRIIVGMFMAEDTLEGKDCTDGILRAHPRYRLQLPKTLQRPFWPYITREKSKQKWGNTTFKYLGNTVGEEILRELRKEKIDGEVLPEEFYRYYCRLNRLDISK